MAGDEINCKLLSSLAASATKSKALIAQGYFRLLAGVPLASAIEGLYIPRAAADTAWSATLTLAAMYQPITP